MIRLTTKLTVLFLPVVLLVFLFQVAVMAGEMTVYSDNGDKISVMGDIRVDAVTHGDVVAVLGNVDVQNTVDGDVVTILGDVNINAKVTGEVVTVFGKVKLGEKAEIAKNLVTIGNLEKFSGARINGQEFRVNTGMLTVLRAISTFIFVFLALVIGLVLITIFRDRFESISLMIEQGVGKQLGIGFLGFMGLCILLVLLFITVLFPLAFLLILVTAESVSSVYFAKTLLNALGSHANIYFQFVVGLLCITFVRLVVILLIPQIGFVTSSVIAGAISVLIYSLGIGILIDSRLGAAVPNNSQR